MTASNNTFINADTSWCATHILHVTHAPSALGHLAALLWNPLWLMHSVVSPFNKINQKFKAGFWKQRCPQSPDLIFIIFASSAQPIISAKVELLAISHHLVRLLPLQFCELLFLLLLLMLRRLPSSDKVWGWETFKHHEVTFTSLSSTLSLPLFLPHSHLWLEWKAIRQSGTWEIE